MKTYCLSSTSHPAHWTRLVLLLALSGCAATGPLPGGGVVTSAAPVAANGDGYKWLNRLTWGASPSAVDVNANKGFDAYLTQQLHPPAARLPDAVNTQIQAMTISQRPMVALVQELEQRNRDANALTDDEAKKAAQQSYQQELNRLGREAATRHVLRDLYSSNQVQEQMTWFWLNHFSVFQYKSNIRPMLADYEDSAIRPRALGKFRDLLKAVAFHPVMLRYLDNEQNASGRINENFARELMELHTLGVGSGYSQRDVQELARVLTGVGVNLQPNNPSLKPDLQGYYVRRGLFEFNPARHDFGPKQLLGQPLHAKGLAEVDEALDRLARQPATATFISRKLAQYWLADEPPRALVERMGQTFQRTDGDIAETLKTMFTAPEFGQGAGRKFKDPMRYVISAVRMAYDDKVILNAGPILNWLNRMGEPLYGRQTPDGYPLNEAAWASPGQMATRFEIAKAIGTGNAGLFRSEGPQPVERAAFPQLSNALYYQSIARTLSPGTRKALDQAASPQEWNTFLLSSPEMMTR
ncbi:DUF1800 domain-containing protein [Polaromonas sp.]|uniref:DUF1800 domain-containing protein n=1 Tax=Polaromonas sp. TaxID=1869339 RepID=UPI003BABDD16